MMAGGMPGAGAQGLTSVKTGLEALQKALTGLPMGSPLHAAVLKAVSDISKHLDEAGPQAGGNPQAVIQQLIQMARGANQQPQAAAMDKMGMGGGAPPPQMGA